LEPVLLKHRLFAGKVLIVYVARQVGKTTLAQRVLAK
jgi:predicted AAA+ superfamily ATPase